MMAKSLQQENDILRFQLNDLINREKNQVSNRRLEYVPTVRNIIHDLDFKNS